MTSQQYLPLGWSLTNLNEITTSFGGGTPSKSDASFWTDGTIPWVSPKDMKSFHIVSSEDSITTAALGRLSLLPVNSVLVVVRSGILARTFPVALNAMPVTINQDMRGFVPLNRISSRFLAWQLVAREREILSSCSKDGTTVASIEGPALANFPLVMAPSAEQTRIVAKLDELLSDLDAGVAELRAAQAKLAQYRQSLLKGAVEGALTADWRARHPPSETGAQLLARILAERRSRWESRQLARFQSQGKTAPKGWQGKYPEPVAPDTRDLPELPEGWVWATVDQLSPGEMANGRSVPTAQSGAKVLRLTAVRNRRIDLHKWKYGAWTEDEATPFAVDDGDLLVVRGNGSLSLVGRAGLVEETGEQIAYPDTLIRVRALEAVVRPAWLAVAWDSGRTRTHIERRARTSAGIYKISQPDIASAVVPIPPLSEQDQALAQFKECDEHAERIWEALQTALAQSAAQRQNLLKAAFSGQLVPQDPADEPASALLERIRAEHTASPATRKRPARRVSHA